MNNDPLIHCISAEKSYHDGHLKVDVLHQINLSVYASDKIAIIGPSGSGKSTLLHLLGGLDNPSRGQVLINQIDWSNMSETKRCQVRNQSFGFIYQFHHLLSEFTALENVAMPLLIKSEPKSIAFDKAHIILKEVGLAHRYNHKQAQLSGGERQRVAIARALVHNPSCVLADEPTGNLDNHTAERIFDLILNLNIAQQTALVIVTHDMKLAKRMDKVYELKSGELQLLT